MASIKKRSKTVVDERLTWKYTGLIEEKGQVPNELQRELVDYIGIKDNLILIAPTASGKSTAISMLGYDKKRILYTGPTRALVEEKRKTWAKEDHPFSLRKTATVTSDYAKNSANQKQLDEAELILMTPESVLSRLRRHTSRNSQFLAEVDLIVIDEGHGVGESGRGGNLEAMLMEFSHLYPSVPILFISGTLPNYNDIASWLEEVNGKTTRVHISDYRPYEIKNHFISYHPGTAFETEKARLDLIIELILSKPTETFLVAVFKRAFGFRLHMELRKRNISVEFHYGQLSETARSRIEDLQKQRLIQVVIATSTLFAGVNLYADNVIASDVYAGGKDLNANVLGQIRGRTGRFANGNAYFLLPAGPVGTHHITRIRTGEPVYSTLRDGTVLATHLLGAVYIGRISQKIDCLLWYMSTLAYRQLDQGVTQAKEVINTALKDMQLRGMLRFEDDKFVLSQKGKIVAQLMLDPYWMYDLTRNFRKFLELPNKTDADLACVFGSCAPFYFPYNTADETGLVPFAVRRIAKKWFWKASSVYYFRLTKQEVPPQFRNINMSIWQDLSRCKEGMLRIGRESENWDKIDLVEKAFIRVASGVSWREADSELARFTKRERMALNRIGIYSKTDVNQNKILASSILSNSRMRELGIVTE